MNTLRCSGPFGRGLTTLINSTRLCSSHSPVAVTEKKKRRTRKSKKVIDEEDRPPRNDYPFYGRHDETYIKDHNNPLEDTPTDASLSYDDAESHCIGKRDTSNGRHYVFQRGCSSERYHLPSVTTVLNETRPAGSWFSLRNWRLGMIQTHGEDGYNRIRQQIVKDGQEFHKILEKRFNKATKGGFVTMSNNGDIIKPKGFNNMTQNMTPYNRTYEPKEKEAFHDHYQWDMLMDLDTCYTNLSSCVANTSPNLSHTIDRYRNYRYMESVKNVLEDVSNVMATEGVVRHTHLGYSGTVDCIARYRGEMCVIDWKTSMKPKRNISDLYDYPLQAVAYAGAVNSDNTFPYKVHRAVIVIVYSTGSQAHVHTLDSNQCLHYWDLWLDRLNQYQTRFANDLTRSA